LNENVVPEGVEINGFKTGAVIDVLSVGFTTDVVLTWNLECLQTFFFRAQKEYLFARASTLFCALQHCTTTTTNCACTFEQAFLSVLLVVWHWGCC
jgi:hypothetical protein